MSVTAIMPAAADAGLGSATDLSVQLIELLAQVPVAEAGHGRFEFLELRARLTGLTHGHREPRHFVRSLVPRRVAGPCGGDDLLPVPDRRRQLAVRFRN